MSRIVFVLGVPNQVQLNIMYIYSCTEPFLELLLFRYSMSYNIFLIHLFIFYLFLFLAALSLCCCPRAFSSCSEQGQLFIAVHRLLIVVASLVAEHRL